MLPALPLHRCSGHLGGGDGGLGGGLRAAEHTVQMGGLRPCQSGNACERTHSQAWHSISSAGLAFKLAWGDWEGGAVDLEGGCMAQ